jgi:hypothetical protein
MNIHAHNSDRNVSVEYEFRVKVFNLSPQTLMPWNGLTLAHYVGCNTWVALIGLFAPYPTHCSIVHIKFQW